MILFYKAKADVSGTACSFQPKFDGKRPGFYCSLIRQATWDQKTKSGSFKANKTNPNASIVIKFGFHEACGIINAFRRNQEYSFYHTSANGTVRGNLNLYRKEDKHIGFSLSATKSAGGRDVKLSIGFSFPEALNLAIYLETFISQYYSDKYAEYIRNAPQESQEQNEPEQTQDDQPPLEADGPSEGIDFSEDDGQAPAETANTPSGEDW